jgi:tRNA uridine 5-carbamoylmethylation protein Kti12
VEKEFSNLCTELKMLYVCITRPKKRLIIYDDDPSSREAIMKYWEKVNAVDVITEEMINSVKVDSGALSEEQRILFEKLKEASKEGEKLDEAALE